MDKLTHNNAGFSTIELMIAMAIMVLVLSAVILVSFGNQSFLIDSQTNAEAMKKAQVLIEQEQSLARKDFNLANPISEVTDDIYKKSTTVQLLSDFLTKQVTSIVKWKNERGLDETVELTTLIANFDTPVGGDTCDSTLSGDWTNPAIENSAVSSQDLATLVHDNVSTYTISDLDAYKGKLYVSASSVSGPTKPTLFIFDSSKIVSDPMNALLGKIDNEGTTPLGTVSSGLNAVHVAEDPSTNKVYAFAINAYDANYSTCNPITTTNCGELEIFDVTTPSNPQLMANLKIMSLIPITGSTYGTSIFYKNGYLLLGLAATNGPEFHIIDVHNVASLFGGSHSVTPVGSLETMDGINAIVMKGTYAYVATTNDISPDKELRTIDISSPSVPSIVGGFDTPGSGNGKSLYLVGNRTYLGNTVPNTGNDFHILDNTLPRSTLPEISGVNLSSSLNAIITRSNLAFLLTDSDLEVFDIGDPSNTTSFTISSALKTLNLPTSSVSPIPEPSMDCEGNRLYLSSNGPSGKGAIYVIKPGP